MRKVITALLTCAVLALPLATAAGASAQATDHQPQIQQGPEYVCDGNGAGTCMSLPSGATPGNGLHLISLGAVAGAWRWIVGTEAHVGDPGYTFSYGPLENQLQGKPVYVFQLYADTKFCAQNAAGDAVIDPCSSALRQAWVLDNSNGYLVNMGRSNDQDNWEVLCNPGTGKELVIGTRDSCSNYHKEWAIVL
jgi:hypothetical protein